MTVTGRDDENTPASAQDSHTLTVTNATPTIDVAKVGPIAIPEGSTARFDYVFSIVNTSPASTDPVTITSVVDDKLGNLTAAAQTAWVAQGNSGPIVLQQGERFTFRVTVNTPFDVGQVVNTVTVSGADDEGTPVQGSDNHTLNVINVAPSLTVDKTAPATVNEGSTITYGFQITNSSQASTDPVTVTSVIDDVLGDLTAAAVAANGGRPIVLAPGQSFSFSVTTAGIHNTGTVINVVTVEGQDNEGTGATATDSATVTVIDVPPQITVDKSAPPTIVEGNAVTYTFTITNTSPASTDPVTVTSVVDNVLGDLTSAANAAWISQGQSGAILLAPGQVFTFTFTQGTPLDSGTIINTVTVTGRDDENTPTAASDSHTLTVANASPTLAVDKTAADILEGTSATYTFTITNTSPASTDPVTVTSVVDNVLGDLTAAANAAWLAQGNTGAIVLAQNEAFSFSVTTAVLDAGAVTNTVIVSGQDDEGTATTANDSHTLNVANVAPTVAVDKTAADILEGTSATYTFTITNTSPASTDPVTITSVVDNVLGDLTAAANTAWLAQGHSGPIVLAPNQTFSFNFTTGVLDAGPVDNTVTVRGVDDENTEAIAQDSHSLNVGNVAPMITIDKMPRPASLKETWPRTASRSRMPARRAPTRWSSPWWSMTSWATSPLPPMRPGRRRDIRAPSSWCRGNRSPSPSPRPRRLTPERWSTP